MNSFSIYRDYYELITLLSERDQQELIWAITRYMFDDIEPKLNKKQEKVFINLRRPLDKSKIKSKNGSSETKENQSKNEIKSKNNQNENKKETHQDVNVNVNNYDSNYVVNDNVSDNVIEEIRKIIDYLNFKTDSRYKYTTEKTQNLIKARINEEFTLEDFKTVIDKKTNEWKGTEFEKYLRPETLFGTKFESYLNQPNKKKSEEEDINDRVREIFGDN